MENYDPSRLNKFKEGILHIYVGNLLKLQNEKVPISFEKFADIFKETIPFFPKNKLKKYTKLLEDGLNQAYYLRHKNLIEGLKKEEPKRLKNIKQFLKNYYGGLKTPKK